MITIEEESISIESMDENSLNEWIAKDIVIKKLVYDDNGVIRTDIDKSVAFLEAVYDFYQAYDDNDDQTKAKLDEVFKAFLNTGMASAVRLGALWWWGAQTGLSGKAGLDAIGWGAVAAILLGLWQSRGYWAWRNIRLGDTFKQNWAFGGWIMGGSLANWVASELYPLLAAGLISFAAAGAYRALQNLVAPVHVLLRATDTFFTPRAAKGFHQSGYAGLSRMLKIIYLVAGVPIFGLLVIATLFPAPLLRLLYGETYLAYSGSLFLMAIYYGLWYAYWPLQTAFKAIRLTSPIFIANLTAIFFMFTVGVWGIRQFGINGAIGGQAINALVITLVLWGTWRKTKRANGGSL